MANFNFNKVILGGRLTQNPELKQTPSGVFVLSFSIAVNRRYASKNEDGTIGQPQADFINCVAWRNQAEFISRFFHRGSSICIVGNIQTRTYNDQQGNKRYVTEVVVDEAMFVDSKGENQSGFNQSYAPAQGDGGYMPSSYNSEPQYSTHTGAASSADAPAQQGGTTPQFEVLEGEDELPF